MKTHDLRKYVTALAGLLCALLAPALADAQFEHPTGTPINATGSFQRLVIGDVGTFSVIAAVSHTNTCQFFILGQNGAGLDRNWALNTSGSDDRVEFINSWNQVSACSSSPIWNPLKFNGFVFDVNANAGNDRIDGTAFGNTWIDAGPGHDRMFVRQASVASGGDGNDLFFWNGPANTGLLSGGNGNDAFCLVSPLWAAVGGEGADTICGSAQSNDTETPSCTPCQGGF